MTERKQAPAGTQLPGYNLWATEIDGCWYIIGLDGYRHAGPFRDEASALWHGQVLVDTSGT